MVFALAALCLQIQTDYLVVDGLLVGAHDSSGWHRPKEWPKSRPLSFAEVSPGERTASFLLGPNPDSSAIVAVGSEVTGVFFSGKAWSPRVATLSFNRESALDLAATFARNRGVSHPRPYLTGVWEIDLDGIGNSEQVIEVVSHPRVRRGKAQQGDWQAVLLRWRSQREERVYPLHFSFPKTGQELADCRLRAIADFDGDGNLEVVTTSKQPSMLSVTLWTFSNGKLIPTLDASYQVDALN